MQEASRKAFGIVTVPLRWADTDMYGHINNVSYMRLFEQARVEVLESLGFPIQPATQDTLPVLVTTTCEYLAQLNYPGSVEIHNYAGDPGYSSLMMWSYMYLQGTDKLYARNTGKLVWINIHSGQAVPLPQRLRALFD